MKIAALFSGCGGLDLGFKKAGFDVIWANEYDKHIWGTYSYNFPDVKLDTRSITQIDSNDVPDVDGIIGGPPCQSWSEAGSGRGINDVRGQLFYDYIRILEAKKPLFFLAENVSGILFQKHSDALHKILQEFSNIGYNLTFKLLNVNDYNVPQDRLRVIIVGLRKDLGKKFTFPHAQGSSLVLKDAIYDLLGKDQPATDKNGVNNGLNIPNHEYMTGGFSTMFMSRNRVRTWDEPSFTIQAGGRHAPIHPQAPKMIKIGVDKFSFVEGYEYLYRRLTVRECARIQTFPDDFIFKYNRVADGYKMVGNAVPVEFAKHLALSIKEQVESKGSLSGDEDSVISTQKESLSA